MFTSKTNVASSHTGTMGSGVDDFGSIRIAAMATVWCAAFLFALISAVCAPVSDLPGVDQSAVMASSATTTLTVPVAAPVAPVAPVSPDESETASGNVLDMTY